VGGKLIVGVSAHSVLTTDKLIVDVGISVGGGVIEGGRDSVVGLWAEHAVERAITKLAIRNGQIFLLIMWDLLIRA
jgi:hypothetical protein